MKDAINIVEESANPLDSPLWNKRDADKFIKAWAEGKPYYLKLNGWEGFSKRPDRINYEPNAFYDNRLPCVVNYKGDQMAIDMGKKSNGETKTSRQQYPNCLGMGLHKLVALVMIKNDDPENLKVVDHVNDINNAYTKLYAAELFKLFEESGAFVEKLVWGPWNLKWASTSKNVKDSRSQDHKRFKEEVAYYDFCGWVKSMPEEHQDTYTVKQAKHMMQEVNEYYEQEMSESYNAQAYYAQMDDFIDNYRQYTKQEYRWWCEDLANYDIDNLKQILPRCIYLDVARIKRFSDAWIDSQLREQSYSGSEWEANCIKIDAEGWEAGDFSISSRVKKIINFTGEQGVNFDHTGNPDGFWVGTADFSVKIS